MRRTNHVLGTAPAIVLAVGCAKGQSVTDAPPGPIDSAAASVDASCGDSCDQDGDGVPDKRDQCPNTPPGAPVNHVGCADSQLMAMLNPHFPPYGLAWTQAGDPGRAAGLTWTYTGIQRGDLFHIYWLVCDDPATPCGLSLDGPIDAADEKWHLSVPDTDLPNGKLIFADTTRIGLAGGATPTLNGRLTVTITDGVNATIPFANVAVLGVNARAASYGAEIKGTAFAVFVREEVQDPSSGAWTPALDYYDAAATPDDAGTNATTSFDGEFYDK